MSAYQVQPLDSFRLARMQMPVPCYFCEHDNAFDAIICRHCTAPMEITRVYNATQVRPAIMPTIGADGVGKSVYLGLMLDILSRQRNHTESLTNDASSIVIQKEIMSALARNSFPERTSSRAEDWRWAHCRLHQRSKKAVRSVFFVDIAGSAMLRGIESPRSYPLIAGLFEKATGVFLIMDGARLQQGDKDEEFFAMELLSHMADVRRRRDAESPSTQRAARQNHSPMPPIAIVLAKSDQIDAGWVSPRDFVQGQAPGVIRVCNDVLTQFDFFTASAAGAVATVTTSEGGTTEVPLRIEPRGIMEPFRWLMRNMSP
jgi:hypothetical protein